MASSVNQRRQPHTKTEAFTSDKHGLSNHGLWTRPTLLKYHEIQAWQQDNDFILSGYRPESSSAPTCFASWVYVHNETFNIFSHLVPAVAFLVAQLLIPQQIGRSFPNARPGDYLIFSFFLWTAFACFSISCVYHTLMSHSMRVSHLCLRTDYVGILVLTLGDFVSGIYLVFYCEPVQQRVYWTMVCVTRLLCFKLS